jgi:hypothetical protein
MSQPTNLERTSLEAHVDLCAIRYAALDERLSKVEEKLDEMHAAISSGQNAMTKVLVTATGTIIAGLLSTIVVVLMKI